MISGMYLGELVRDLTNYGLVFNDIFADILKTFGATQ